ncbi:cation diffusion facilitator family transporter [Planococcus lenghuensis]|uniref:Cation transporter n=1 Tax=Planococcus lenghuensis TaxID=2213202 RepID=A0A1Q2KUQ6_9BACL|nr:cation diffusion facilitator family transporter [Planococcus lenghuensis]AQQ51919.1 cation transporter [Planococcus lenghuensis]
MKEYFRLLKGGATSALWAAIVNTTLGIIKTIAYLISGNVAMFAEMLHSYGDAANQFFVFIGSALSKKEPTERFPGGFGRLVNLVLLGAVIVVGVLAYETIIEGYHHILHPAADDEWFWLNVGVLALAVVLEAFVLWKAMKEVLHEVPDVQASGFGIIPASIKNLKSAKPATRLVFLEDTVAVSGALLALIAVVIAAYTSFDSATGYASIIIGVLLILVVGRIFLDNAAGALGAADLELQQRVGDRVITHPDVHDVADLDIVTEGDHRHVELKIEVDPKMTIAEADDLRDYLEERIREVRGVTDVIIEFDEDDKVPTWSDPKGEK